MTEEAPISEAYERVLTVAEHLFMERGYTSVKLRDIADELGIKQASLYYHVPGGKEDLFVSVVERNMNRHRVNMQAAIEDAGTDWVEQLNAIADWLFTQPPMDLTRMVQSDLPALSPEHLERLTYVSYQSIFEPVIGVFDSAIEQGLMKHVDKDLMAGVFLSSVQAIHGIRTEWTERTKNDMAREVIDVFVNGLKPA